MSRNYFSTFVLKWDVVRLIKNPFINIKRQLMVTNFTLVLCKIAEKNYIRCNIYTNFPANIRLGEDVLKISSRRLQCNIFFVFQNVLKTAWRRLEDIIAIRLANTSWRRLGRRLARRLEDILGRRIANTSWRRLEDVLEDEKCYAEDVFKTSWKTRNVCWVNSNLPIY